MILLLLLTLLLIQKAAGDVLDDLLKKVDLQHQNFSLKLEQYQNQYNETKNTIEAYRDWYMKELFKETLDIELARVRINYESHTEPEVCHKNLNGDLKILHKVYDYKKCYPEMHYVSILRRFHKFQDILEQFKEIGSECHLKKGYETLEECLRIETEKCIRALVDLEFDIKDFLESALHFSANCVMLKTFDWKNDALEVSFNYFKCAYEQPGAKIN